MAEPLRVAFFGSIAADQLGLKFPLIKELDGASPKIAEEIEKELTTTIGVPVRVSIQFREGSIEWFGSAEFLSAMWGAVEVMASLGGAIALIQMVVNRVLRRWFRLFLGYEPGHDQLNTQVVIVSVPSSVGPDSLQLRIKSDIQSSLFGLAAVIASLAALVAAVAAVIVAISKLV